MYYRHLRQIMPISAMDFHFVAPFALMLAALAAALPHLTSFMGVFPIGAKLNGKPAHFLRHE